MSLALVTTVEEYLHRPAWHISLGGEKGRAGDANLYACGVQSTRPRPALCACPRELGCKAKRWARQPELDGGLSGERCCLHGLRRVRSESYAFQHCSANHHMLSRTGSRLVASTSTAPAAAAAFHSSAVAHAKVKTRKEANIRSRDERARKEALNRPHVVLGYRPGDEAKWKNCDLAKILVTEKDIQNMAPIPDTVPDNAQEVVIPEFFNYGLKEKERERLFETLPVLTAEAHVKNVLATAGHLLPQEMVPVAENAQREGEAAQLYKAQLLARVVDLRNANARGIAYENRQRCVAAFSEPSKPNDTGRPEVQGAPRRTPAPIRSAHAELRSRDSDHADTERLGPPHGEQKRHCGAS